MTLSTQAAEMTLFMQVPVMTGFGQELAMILSLQAQATTPSLVKADMTFSLAVAGMIQLQAEAAQTASLVNQVMTHFR